jgi:arginase
LHTALNEWDREQHAPNELGNQSDDEGDDDRRREWRSGGDKQGGNIHNYYFGSHLLAWLAPPARGPVETIPVPEPQPGETLAVENGMLARGALLQQARAARQAIEKHQPDRIVTLGGDCLVDLAPMAYLNTRYGCNLGVLWIDAHLDVLTPKHFAQGNAQVLRALLRRGDPDLIGEVDTPFTPSRVMHAGVDSWMPIEDEVITELGLRHAGADALADSSAPVLEWIEGERIRHLAVHFDVDVHDSKQFSPTLENDPNPPADVQTGLEFPSGRMAPEHVVRLLHDVAATCDIVGLAITEYVPWEAIATRKLLQKLPLLGG